MVGSGQIRLLLSSIVVTLILSSAIGDPHEKKLFADLLGSYQLLERPVENSKSPLTVFIGLSLRKLIYVDEKWGGITTHLQLKLEWNDFNLRWLPESHGNITSLLIPPHRMWKPEILVENSEDRNYDSTYQTNNLVMSNGNVTYNPPGIFSTSCKMDYLNYPFEVHECDIKLKSWTYDSFKLDLQLKDANGVDISEYIASDDWELLETHSRRNEVKNPCCAAPQVDITFSVHLRKLGQQKYDWARLLNGITFGLLVLSFWIPPASFHKITLALGSLVLAIFSHIDLDGPLPPVYRSLLVHYFRCLILLSFLGLVLNVITVCIFHQIGSMPEWVRAALLKIPSSPLRILCPSRKALKSGQRVTGSTNAENFIALPKPETETVDNDDWKYAALILDRCFLVIFIVILAFTYATRFPSYQLLNVEN